MITILDLAVARGVVAETDGAITASAFDRVGLPFFGGCQGCAASIAAFNAYPSKTGFLRCRDCIGDLGFASADEFEAFCKSEDQS